MHKQVKCTEGASNSENRAAVSAGIPVPTVDSGWTSLQCWLSDHSLKEKERASSTPQEGQCGSPEVESRHVRGTAEWTWKRHGIKKGRREPSIRALGVGVSLLTGSCWNKKPLEVSEEKASEIWLACYNEVQLSTLLKDKSSWHIWGH